MDLLTLISRVLPGVPVVHRPRVEQPLPVLPREKAINVYFETRVDVDAIACAVDGARRSLDLDPQSHFVLGLMLRARQDAIVTDDEVAMIQAKRRVTLVFMWPGGEVRGAP